MNEAHRVGRDGRFLSSFRAVPIVAVLLALILSGFLAGFGLSPASAPGGPSPTVHSPVLPAPSSAVRTAAHPLDPTDNFTCFKINTTICVSAKNGSYNVVPTPGNLTSNTLPLPNATIYLYVKSTYPLAAISPPSPTGNSNKTPVRINVSGVLWNGDPYMNAYDGTIWHSNTNSNYWSTVSGVTNKTYPYWYQVVIDGNNSGVPNFFPGEYVSWSIYIVSLHPSGVYTHLSSPTFHYRIATAWAFSPYPGAAQFGGSNASTLDLQVYQNPLIPNWNDSTNVTLRTTAADAADNNSALIGSALLTVAATLPDGTALPNLTVSFESPGVGVRGLTSTYAVIPANYAHVPGTEVTYTIVAFDAVASQFTPDQITLPAQGYIVNGNGTFVSGIFSDDVQVTVTTNYGLVPEIHSGRNTAVLPPGTEVHVMVSSTNLGTALQSAVLVYSFSLPTLHEVVGGQFYLGRVNSTNLFGSLPAIPLGGYLNFTLTVWDYAAAPEMSPVFGYSIQSFAQVVPSLGPNLGFLWIYVYDNGTRTWVSGADVTVVGAGGYVNVQTKSLFGIAYPNASLSPEVPLLLPVNISYNVSVIDSSFVAPGAAGAVGSISVSVELLHTMTTQATLAQTSDYTVVLSGNQLFFWLNSTAPGPTFAPAPLITPSLIAPALGLVVALAAMLPIVWWWRDISERRREQEKRVTL